MTKTQPRLYPQESSFTPRLYGVASGDDAPPAPAPPTPHPDAQPNPMLPNYEPKPPTRDLTPYGMTLWKHYYVKLCVDNREAPDLFMLEDYCHHAQELRTQEDLLSKQPKKITTSMGEKPNPLVGVCDKMRTQKRHLEAELGIGTHTRRRIKRLDGKPGDTPVTGGEPAGKWD